MKKMIMYVYGDIQTDARVKRAANALAKNYDLTLLSSDCGVDIKSPDYKNVLLKCQSSGLRGYLQSVREALKIVKTEKPDVFYAHDYYSALLARLLIKRNHCGKIVYDAHELIIPEKSQNDSHLKLFYWIESTIVHKVDLLICASQERAKLMKDHYNLEKEPLVVENISYLSTSGDISTLEKSEELNVFFKDKVPTIVYAGVVTKSRKLDKLLDLAIKMAPTVKLLIVGKGSALSELQEKACGQKVLHYCFTGALPYEMLGSLLSKCDVGYLYYPVDTLNNVNCASNKVYEYASVGLPIVANDNPTIKSILEVGRIGVASNNIEDAVSQVLASLNEYKSACEVFVRENSWERTKENLLTSIEKI